MKESNELPEKRTETEDPKAKKTSPVAPVIETPIPPQVMDPSVIPHIERKRPLNQPGKRARKASKTSPQAR
jgi:hypothetical protein